MVNAQGKRVFDEMLETVSQVSSRGVTPGIRDSRDLGRISSLE
jgi:hypothetical protein